MIVPEVVRRGFVVVAMVAAALVISVRPASAVCDVNYTGPADDLWATPGNWDGNAVPTTAQIACIPAGKGTIVIANGVAATVKSITAASGLQVASGGSLAISDATNAFTNTLVDLAVPAGATVSSAGSGLSTSGQVVVDGTIDANVQVTGGTLDGAGTITKSLQHMAGTVRPGGAGTVGTLTLGLAYNQQAGATLELDLASDSSFDEIDGPHFNHFLEGQIVVHLLGGYLPTVGTSWNFIPPDGFGTSVNVQVTPSNFSAHSISQGAALSLDTALSSSTSTTTPAQPTTTTTLATCGNGQLDPGEECDGTEFDNATCGSPKSDCRRCTSACTVVCVLCDAAPVDAFILPRTLVVRPNTKTPAKSRMLAAGIFDTGPQPADLGVTATLDVGGLSVAAGVPEAAGNGFVLKAAGLVFKVVPARTKSSKAIFRMKLQRDLTGVDPDAPLTMHFANATTDGTGTVRLTKGRYRLRHEPGDLIAPTLYLASVRAKVVGGRKDSLALQLGLSTDGHTPAAAPDVSVVFGSTFAVRIPGGGFTKQGDRFTAMAGGAQVVLDYGHELLTVRARHVDLGAFADGAQPVTVALGLGDDSRANDVRMVHKGKALRY